MRSKWHRTDVDATSSRRIEVSATLFDHHVVSTSMRRHADLVPAGLTENLRSGKKILQICAARIWSDAVIRPAYFGPFRPMYYLDGDPIGKPRVIHWQIS